MPNYEHISLTYEPYEGKSAVFVKSAETFSCNDLKKNSAALSKARQNFFELQLGRIASHLNTEEIPVWIQWKNGKRLRMDKGCIGHSVARGFIVPPQNGVGGFVTHIKLQGAS